MDKPKKPRKPSGLPYGRPIAPVKPNKEMKKVGRKVFNVSQYWPKTKVADIMHALEEAKTDPEAVVYIESPALDEITLVIEAVEELCDNPDYQEQLEQYNKEYEKYKKLLDKWNKYNKDMEAYRKEVSDYHNYRQYKKLKEKYG